MAIDRKEILNVVGLKLFNFAEKWLGVRDIATCERRGAMIGMALYRLDRKHRERTVANLALVFPELSESERVEMSKKMFQHFGITAADFLRSPHRSNEELLEQMVHAEPEKFADALSHGKGVIAVTCHLGNWERFGHWCLAKGFAITSVARDANDGTVQEKVDAIRVQNGMKTISRGNAVRQILATLKKNEIIGILPDQNADEAYIPFFGRPAGTVLGPAVIHLRTGAPILPCCCLRVGVGKYEMFIDDLIYAQPDETPEALMTRVNQAVEKLILRAPEQYLWMHDRWKNARRKGLF